MFKNSLIQETKQLWKLVAGLIALGLGFFLMAYGLGDLKRASAHAFVLTGMLIDLGGFAAMCIAVRCPSCGMRWVWAAVKGQEQSQWINWLRAQRACPRCGYHPVATSQHEAGEKNISPPLP